MAGNNQFDFFDPTGVLSKTRLKTPSATNPFDPLKPIQVLDTSAVAPPAQKPAAQPDLTLSDYINMVPIARAFSGLRPGQQLPTRNTGHDLLRDFREQVLSTYKRYGFAPAVGTALRELLGHTAGRLITETGNKLEPTARAVFGTLDRRAATPAAPVAATPAAPVAATPATTPLPNIPELQGILPSEIPVGEVTRLPTGNSEITSAIRNAQGGIGTITAQADAFSGTPGTLNVVPGLSDTDRLRAMQAFIRDGQFANASALARNQDELRFVDQSRQLSEIDRQLASPISLNQSFGTFFADAGNRRNLRSQADLIRKGRQAERLQGIKSIGSARTAQTTAAGNLRLELLKNALRSRDPTKIASALRDIGQFYEKTQLDASGNPLPGSVPLENLVRAAGLPLRSNPFNADYSKLVTPEIANEIFTTLARSNGRTVASLSPEEKNTALKIYLQRTGKIR